MIFFENYIPHRIIILHLYIGIPRFVAFCFIGFLTNWRHQSSLLVLFSNSICLLHVSVTSGNPHNISKFFTKIIFVMVICDVTIVMVLGCHKPCSCKTVFGLLHWPAISLPLFLSLGLPIPWDRTILKFGQLITLEWLLTVQVKGKVTYLSL